MSPGHSPPWIETLPDPLPADPLELASQWLAQARIDAAQPNPNAMVLATVDENGQPSARVVLCKDIVPETGHIVFYTNYQSRKGRELRKNPRAAIVFHWDHRHRQVRAEGHVEPLDDAQNDAYFRTRPWQSRIGAWASRQSEPVASRAEMGESVAAAARAENSRIAEVRIALGSVAPTVLRAAETENLLRGESPSPALVQAARESLAREIAPIDDIRSTARYRLRVAQNLLAEFLETVAH